MKHAFRSALVITLFTFSSQLVLFACQLVAAAQFGATRDMDAFLAASTMPQFTISILLGSLSFVFIPFFVDHASKGDEEKAFRLSVTLFNNCILFLGLITIVGILFARQILEITTPGLLPETLDMSVRVAMITWPTVIATGAVALLSSIHQARKEFVWQALVPFIGALTNLLLLIYLAPFLGIIGLAWATTLGVIIQMALLLRLFAKHGRYHFRLNWSDDELKQILRVATPLILVALLTKFTPLLDRFLASSLKEGSISHLSYALRVVTLGSLLISTGISTVIFPKMALDVSKSDLGALRETMTFGLRIMWAVVAPVIAIGAVLSLPAIILLFCRGEFTMDDSVAVSDLMKIYLIALAAMCLGTLTGKGFYAMKDTRTLAMFGIIEAIAYVCYTIYLARNYGATGIAIGYVIYFSLSLLWQAVVLQIRLGKGNVGQLTRSFLVTAASAIVAGGSSYFAVGLLSDMFVKILVGGSVGLLVYIGVLYILGSTELTLLKDALFTSVRSRAQNTPSSNED